MIDSIRLYKGCRLHFTLPKQRGLTLDKFSNRKKSIIRDDKEIVIAALITAHQTHAVFIRSSKFYRICFDAHISKILLRRRPEIQAGLLYQNPKATIEVIHDAAIIGETVPARGAGIELIFKEDSPRSRMRYWRRYRSGGSTRGKQKEEKRKQNNA